MDWMANRRLELAERRRTSERGAVSQTSHKAGVEVRTAIRDLPSAARRPLAAAFDQYERSQVIDAALRRCQDELAGSVHPARRPWRTLVRVHDAEEADYCHVVVPAWDPHKKIRLYFQDIPEEVRQRVKVGARLHAKVNIGADSFEEIYFDEWEPE